MNYDSVLSYIRRLTTFDIQAWRYLPYKVKMKLVGIDLSLVSIEQSGLSYERSHLHSDSGGPDLKGLLDRLPIEKSDAVIDLGCGKGGAMLTLAQYPFLFVDGVELSNQLADTAFKNLQTKRISNARVFCMDAADFVDLDPYTHIYMYNPFPELVMRCVLKNLNESLLRRERSLTLIYKNPVFNSLLLEHGFTKILQTEQRHRDYPAFGVYLADGTSARSRLRGSTDTSVLAQNCAGSGGS
jgi:SAM-dependent methyltransferase